MAMTLKAQVHQTGSAPRATRDLRAGVVRAAAVGLVVMGLLPDSVTAATWSCYGNKPGHPTAEQRAAFVREAADLALEAERKYGVPASALAALAISESGYGWTRLALEANNLFGWKFGSSAREDGLTHYTLPCQRPRLRRHRYARFPTRSAAFDYVAAKLATLDGYRRHTEAYKAARAAGQPADAAAEAWVSGIASLYSRAPDRFVSKIRSIMHNPLEPADAPSPVHTLHRLSARVHAR